MSYVLDKIQMWVHSNLFKLIIDKKPVLVCGKSVTLNICRARFSMFEKTSGTSYRQSDDVQVLGLIVEEQLDFEKMVSQMCKPSCYSLHELYDLWHYFDRNLKMTLVKTLVLAKTDNCHIVLCKLSMYEIPKLHKAINSGIRFLCNIYKRYNIIPYMKSCQ